jgi:nicotinamidase-related amidase
MTALVLIDLQKAIDHPKWRQHGDRNNFEAEENIGHLLQAWRRNQRPIYHIRHDSTEPESPYRPHQLGNQFKPFAAPHPGETVIAKQTNSAFIGTTLESALRAAGHDTLVVCGVITVLNRPICSLRNFSVSDLKSERLAGLKAFIWSNLCTR